tara:strand:+ start:975 stop:1121 length:147 start_codon:yes stop_codon:yes gene_type:complete
MLSIEKCNEILNKDEKKYTKEEVLAIRESLYQLAELIMNIKENEESER